VEASVHFRYNQPNPAGSGEHILTSYDKIDDIMFISHMQPCCLEWYKQMDEKRALLDAAIATCDGNCITTILLFIRKTLEFSMYSLVPLQYKCLTGSLSV